jgi:hypothetical protein
MISRNDTSNYGMISNNNSSGISNDDLFNLLQNLEAKTSQILNSQQQQQQYANSSTNHSINKINNKARPMCDTDVNVTDDVILPDDILLSTMEPTLNFANQIGNLLTYNFSLSQNRVNTLINNDLAASENRIQSLMNLNFTVFEDKIINLLTALLDAYKVDTSQMITGLLNGSEARIERYIDEIDKCSGVDNGQLLISNERMNEYLNSAIRQININTQSSEARINGNISTAVGQISNLLYASENRTSALIVSSANDLYTKISDMASAMSSAIYAFTQNLVQNSQQSIIANQNVLCNLITSAERAIIAKQIELSNVIITDISNNCSCSISGSGGNNNMTLKEVSDALIQNQMIHNLVISDTVTTIVSYFTNVILGNYDEITTVFTIDQFELLSEQLYAFKSALADTSDYEIIRNIITKSFESLWITTKQYITNLNISEELITVKQKAAILDNLQLLQDYINKLNSTENINIIPDVPIEAPVFTVRPEILKYIQLYGYPPGGIFDVDLLGAIMENA